jgi:hypothetical protein
VADPSACAEYRFHDNVLVSSAAAPTYAENRFHYNVLVSSAAVPTYTENRFHYNFQITNHRSCCTSAENRFHKIATTGTPIIQNRAAYAWTHLFATNVFAHLIECRMSCMTVTNVRNQRLDSQHYRYFLTIHVQVMMCVRRCWSACGVRCLSVSTLQRFKQLHGAVGEGSARCGGPCLAAAMDAFMQVAWSFDGGATWWQSLCVCVSDSKIRQRTTAHDIACMCLFGMVGDSMLQVRVCATFIIGVSLVCCQML